MLKKINRLLKLVGLNLVRAKRKKVVKTTGLERYTPSDEVKLSDYMGESEWQSTPPIGEGISTPCKTHFVGDDCPGGHGEWKGAPPTGEVGPVGEVGSLGQCCGLNSHPDHARDIDDKPRVLQPNSDNKITGPTS